MAYQELRPFISILDMLPPLKSHLGSLFIGKSLKPGPRLAVYCSDIHGAAKCKYTCYSGGGSIPKRAPKVLWGYYCKSRPLRDIVIRGSVRQNGRGAGR